MVHSPDLDGESKLPGLVNVYKKLLKMAIEIVDFPIKHGWIFHSHVKLPLNHHFSRRFQEISPEQKNSAATSCFPLDGSTPCAAATTGTLVLHLPHSADTASPDTDTPRLGWRSGENVLCFNTCMHIVYIYIYIYIHLLYVFIYTYIYIYTLYTYYIHIYTYI